MCKNLLKLSFVFIFVCFLNGCLIYRTSSTITMTDPTITSQLEPTQESVRIITKNVPKEKYQTLGFVEAKVCKRFWFTTRPKQERVDALLKKKAASVGADALVKVKYEKIKPKWSIRFIPFVALFRTDLNGGINGVGVAVKTNVPVKQEQQ